MNDAALLTLEFVNGAHGVINVSAVAHIDAILADRPVSPNFYDGFKAQAVIDAARESHRRGCWVAVTA